MIINDIMQKNNISKYKLSKDADVPYTTISDICNEKTNLAKCSAETVYKIAKVLHVSMEKLLEPVIEYQNNRCSFDLYKSNVCHQLKELDDIHFIVSVLESNDIRNYYKKKWYPEAFYLLAMLDYISRLNNIPLCTEYDDLRHQKLEKIIYPSSVIAIYAINKDEKVKEKAFEDSIPEFKKYNIVESDIRNVI